MLWFTLISSILTSFLFVTAITANDLPSYFPKCYIEDPELNNCLLDGFRSLKSYIGNGIEEIGLPSLKPLFVSKLRISQNAPLARYAMVARNFTFTGLDDYDVKEFGYDPITMTFHGTMEYKEIIVSAILDITGHIIFIPLEGMSPIKVIFGPVNGSFKISGNMRNENGVDYYNTINISVSLDIADASGGFDNLFGGNVYLTRATNDLLNANSKLIVDVLTPMYEELTKYGIENLMTSLTNAIPYNQMFPRRN